MATEPIQGGPYPLQSDRADVPGDIKKVVDWAAPKLNMTFASMGELESQVVSPVDGMFATVGSGSAATAYAYMDGDWRPLMTKGVAGRRDGGSGQSLVANTLVTVNPGPLAWSLGGVTLSGDGMQVPVDGLYAIDGTVRTLNGPGNILQGRLLVNGVAVAMNQTTNDLRYCSMATTVPLAAGDIVTLGAYQYTAAINTSASNGDPHLTVALIART